MDFRIRYRVHHRVPAAPLEETKQETVIDHHGTVIVRNHDRSGPDGHFRLSGRTESSVSAEDAENLYRQIMDLLHHHESIMLSDDTDCEIILEEPGIRISLDAGLSDGTVTGAKLFEAFMDRVVRSKRSA